MELLYNYDVCEFSQSSSSLERAKVLASHLNLKHLTSEELKSIEDNCKKYTEIFYLPSDRLTASNIYIKKNILKPNTPTYTKQYRLPHSLKSDVDKQIQKY